MTLDPRGSPNRLPAPGAGFVWEVVEGVPGLRPETGGAVAAFTTRLGGCSSGVYASLNLSFDVGDDEDAVARNRQRACWLVGSGGEWSTLDQVHGAEVVEAAQPGQRPRADGQRASDPGRLLAVLSADCVPVLCVGGGKVAVAHAGWRGILAGIVEAAVRAVDAREVFLGPAIGPCCFEVGPEVEASFGRALAAALAGPRRVDLWRAAEVAASQAGAGRIRSCRLCTSCHPRLFFSHRRDGVPTGRQALLARVHGA